VQRKDFKQLATNKYSCIHALHAMLEKRFVLLCCSSLDQNVLTEIPAWWPQTWNIQVFLWTWKTHGILREFCAISGKLTFWSGCSLYQAIHMNEMVYAAKCIWCTKTVDLSNMGRQGLVILVTW